MGETEKGGSSDAGEPPPRRRTTRPCSARLDTGADVGEPRERVQYFAMVVGEVTNDDVGVADRLELREARRDVARVTDDQRVTIEAAVTRVDDRTRDAPRVVARRADVDVAPDRDRGR